MATERTLTITTDQLGKPLAVGGRYYVTLKTACRCGFPIVMEVHEKPSVRARRLTGRKRGGKI